MSIQKRYPNLDHFIGTEFLQDFDSGVTLDSAVGSYVVVYDAKQSRAVLDEARRFLREQHNDIEAAFAGFKPQIYPPGGGCTTSEWVAQIARLFDSALSRDKIRPAG